MESWNSNKIPVYKELISLVRTLDGFSAKELEQLKAILEVAGTTASGQKVQFGTEPLDAKTESFLKNTLKIHQVLSLLDVDFSNAVSDKKAHLASLLDLLG